MSEKTRAQLKGDFSNNQRATGEKFADLIDSFKMIQSAVSDPAAAGTSVTFIATISQDKEGRITVTKKTVNFNGYQTVAGMSDYQTVADMDNYQRNDVQQVGVVTAVAGGSQDIAHKMGHYPTVRLVDKTTYEEIKPGSYIVVHTSKDDLRLTLDAGLKGGFLYILD